MDIGDDNVTKLPVRFKNPMPEDRTLVRPWEVQRYGECTHDKFIVDDKKLEVECGKCGERLNPMWVLVQLCSKDMRMHEAAKRFPAASRVSIPRHSNLRSVSWAPEVFFQPMWSLISRAVGNIGLDAIKSSTFCWAGVNPLLASLMASVRRSPRAFRAQDQRSKAPAVPPLHQPPRRRQSSRRSWRTSWLSV